MEFDPNSPIYLQLLAYFRKMIVSGQWESGARMDPVRELALRFSVNPNTVQRALQELERDGLCVSERTAGRFITDDRNRIEQMRQALAEAAATDLIKALSELGVTKEEARELLGKYWTQQRRHEHDSD